MKKTLETSIIINSTPKKVWEILTDFESYPQWNSFITEIKGELKIGNQLKANIGGMKFSPIILTHSSVSHFSWKGKLLINGLFDGEHLFRLVDNQDETTTFHQAENFSGILVGLFSKKLDNETLEGFKKMNEELKKRAEN